ncbi:putative membrane protein [Providencia alcalifaciens]|nr:putative membrane protein [Providencia alcalifaciens]
MAINRAGRVEHQLLQQNQRITLLELELKQCSDRAIESQTELISSSEALLEREEFQTGPSKNKSNNSSESIFHDLESAAFRQIESSQITIKSVNLSPQQTFNSVSSEADINRLNKSQELANHINVNRFDNRAIKTNTTHNDQNDGNWSIFSHFFSWIWQGNPLAKIGILLLFFGIGYLLKFSIQNDVLSPLMRLMFSAIGCLILLGTGWYLRHKKLLFALILQGGAIGCFYITVFAAFKLYTMLPYSMAFVAMILICAASIMLALLQRAISLAILATLGGYLAPVLLSTGDGNHILLFSYYLMLSVGILVISVWQAWRPLNLIGMFMTYSVAILWGWNHYQTEYYVSSQIFLVANLIVFNVLTQLFALRYQHEKQMVVDYTLLFIPPFISLFLQYMISWQFSFLPAFSALLLGMLYLLAGLQIHKRYTESGKSLALGNIVIGACFASLAIPLALTFEWTSIIWSVEGLLLLWYGFQQQNKKLISVGVLLILVSAATLLSGFSLYEWSKTSTYMVPVLLMTCFCAGAVFYVHRTTSYNFKAISYGFLLLGLVIWFLWIPVITDILSWSGQSESFVIMVLVVISVWLWRFLAIKTDWVPLLLCQSFIWIIGYYYLALDFIHDENPMGRGEGSLIWPVILGSSILFVMHAHKARNVWMRRVLHGATFWLILTFIAAQVNWFVAILPWGIRELGYFIYVMTITLAILVMYWLQIQKCPPMKRNGMIYWYSFLPIIIILIGLSFIANLEDGKLTFWNYIPLINPLDEAGLFSIASLFLMRRALVQKLKRVTQFDLIVIRGLSFSGIVLSALWFNGIILRALSDFAGIHWVFDALFDSRLVQTVLSISWSIVALGFMLFAGVKQNRISWFFGAGIFTCVIAKLFLVDIYGQDGLSRAISFIAVAVLILVVGYFSPLPPKKAQGIGAEKFDDADKK